MRYADSTLANFTAKALDAIQEARQRLGLIKVHIAKGNRKVGRVWNVSNMPRVCCGNCSTCEHYCYDIKACIQYKNVMTARAENTALAQDDPVEYFTQIVNRLTPRIKRKYFRWHVGGEILNKEYFTCMCLVASARPDWKFWTYTKMHDLVNQYIAEGGYIPDNLTVLYSKDRNAVVPNPYGMPEAYTVIDGDTEDGHGFKCPGNCEVCIDLERGCPFGESVYFLEH